MIPKVIHYCWFGKNPLPGDVKKCIESWKKHCPDYEIKQWDESNFDVEAHSFMKEAYEAKSWAFVSDYARLKVIYDNGGIYLDTDVELLKNIDFLLENKGFIGVQQDRHLCATGLGFGAEKENIVIKRMMEKYDTLSFDFNNKMEISCPILNTEALREFGFVYTEDIQRLEDMIIYPPEYFDPLSPGHENLKGENTISIHHYSATWVGGKAMLKRKIMRLIGQERVFKIKRILKL